MMRYSSEPLVVNPLVKNINSFTDSDEYALYTFHYHYDDTYILETVARVGRGVWDTKRRLFYCLARDAAANDIPLTIYSVEGTL
jgi:hypothetical protein